MIPRRWRLRFRFFKSLSFRKQNRYSRLKRSYLILTPTDELQTMALVGSQVACIHQPIGLPGARGWFAGAGLLSMGIMLLVGCGDGYDPVPPPKPLAPAAPETFTLRSLTVNGDDLGAGGTATVVAEHPIEIVGVMDFPKDPPDSRYLVVSIIKEVDEVPVTLNSGLATFEAPKGRTYRLTAALDAPAETGTFELRVVAMPARAKGPETDESRYETRPVVYVRAPVTITAAK